MFDEVLSHCTAASRTLGIAQQLKSCQNAGEDYKSILHVLFRPLQKKSDRIISTNEIAICALAEIQEVVRSVTVSFGL